jgi:hypothetical protein
MRTYLSTTGPLYSRWPLVWSHPKDTQMLNAYHVCWWCKDGGLQKKSSCSQRKCLPFRNTCVHCRIFDGVRVTGSLEFYVYCRSLFVRPSFLFCLSVFDLQIMIMTLVSSNSSSDTSGEGTMKNTRQKPTYWAARFSLMFWGELWYSGRG